MTAIMTTCPLTSQPVPTGHHATAAQLQAGAPAGGRFRCRACGEIHAWTFEEAWVAGREAYGWRFD